MNEMISGAIVFNGERSRHGYRLNRMAMSLTSAANRTRFKTDEVGYMRDAGLHAGEVELVRRRDWKGMLEHGASIYLVIKIAGAVGHSLQQVGAHTAGMTLDEFYARKGH